MSRFDEPKNLPLTDDHDHEAHAHIKLYGRAGELCLRLQTEVQGVLAECVHTPGLEPADRVRVSSDSHGPWLVAWSDDLAEYVWFDGPYHGRRVGDPDQAVIWVPRLLGVATK